MNENRNNPVKIKEDENSKDDENEWLCNYLATDETLLRVVNKNTDTLQNEQITAAYNYLNSKWNVSSLHKSCYSGIKVLSQ